MDFLDTTMKSMLRFLHQLNSRGSVMSNTSQNEPTPDQISSAILEMLNTLLLLEDLPDIPFPENVKRAIRGFDTPKLRSSLVSRLYHPERYSAQSMPRP